MFHRSFPRTKSAVSREYEWEQMNQERFYHETMERWATHKTRRVTWNLHRMRRMLRESAQQVSQVVERMHEMTPKSSEMTWDFSFCRDTQNDPFALHVAEKQSEFVNQNDRKQYTEEGQFIHDERRPDEGGSAAGSVRDAQDSV